ATLTPCTRRSLLLLSSAAAGLSLLEDAFVRLGVSDISEERVGHGNLAIRQVHRGRGRPVLAEELLDRGYGGTPKLDKRVAIPCVGNGGPQDIAQPHRAEVAQD